MFKALDGIAFGIATAVMLLRDGWTLDRLVDWLMVFWIVVQLCHLAYYFGRRRTV